MGTTSHYVPQILLGHEYFHFPLHPDVHKWKLQKHWSLSFFFLFLKKIFNIDLFFRERDRAWAGEGRERGTQNLKQASGSELSAQSLTWGSNPRAGRSWPEPESVAELTDPPRCPTPVSFLMFQRWAYFTLKIHDPGCLTNLIHMAQLLRDLLLQSHRGLNLLSH